MSKEIDFTQVRSAVAQIGKAWEVVKAHNSFGIFLFFTLLLYLMAGVLGLLRLFGLI